LHQPHLDLFILRVQLHTASVVLIGLVIFPEIVLSFSFQREVFVDLWVESDRPFDVMFAIRILRGVKGLDREIIIGQ
jgi:hypothetical protein